MENKPNEAVIQNFEKVKTILEKIAETRSLDPALMEEALTICDKYPQVLEVQYGSEQQNLGMIAAFLEHDYMLKSLDKIMLKSLDNKEASLQQDKQGRNIGMYAAMLRIETVTLKALDNKEASLQQSKSGHNIGMYAAISKMENATLKALDNEEASLQQEEYGYNIGMYAAASNLENATSKALDNEKASIQQNKRGYNIGMLSALSKMENATLKALDNEEASIQQNKRGNNIGMLAAESGMVEATLKALLGNRDAMKKKNDLGYSIKDIATKNPKMVKVLKEASKIKALNKKTSKGEPSDTEQSLGL